MRYIADNTLIADEMESGRCDGQHARIYRCCITMLPHIRHTNGESSRAVSGIFGSHADKSKIKNKRKKAAVMFAFGFRVGYACRMLVRSGFY